MNLKEIAEDLADELVRAKQLKIKNGGVFMRSDMGPVILRVLESHAFIPKKKRKGSPRPRKRDEIFDLLSKLDGQDPSQLTRHGASRVATAKKQILEVMPEATSIEVMEEINRRWSAWCRKHTDKKVQTVMALITHWAELGGGRKTKTEALDVYREPDFDWREDLAQKYPGSSFVEELADKGWNDVPLDVRKAMLVERMNEPV